MHLHPEKLTKEIAFVVPSCDKYCDLWNPLFDNLALTWPDLPFRIYLISNYLDYDREGVSVIQVGDDTTWSENLIKGLEKVSEENIFLLIDDLFFSERIDHIAVLKMFERFVVGGFNYLRMNPTPGPGFGRTEANIGLVNPGAAYRSSTVLCLWKKSTLLQTLDRKENAWELEIAGSARTDRFGEWYASRKWMMPYHNLVIKGRYDPSAFNAIVKKGIVLNTARPRMNSFQHLTYRAKKVRSAVFKIVPTKLRRRIRGYFHAGGIA